MAEQDDSADKSHEPTQKKLDDARKKGEIARSNDVNVALSYFGVWLFLLSVGAFAMSNLGAVLQSELEHAMNPQLNLDFSPSLFAPLLYSAGSFVGLFAAVPACLIVLILLSQRALIFTPSKNSDVIIGSSAGTDRNAILVLYELVKSLLSLVVLIAAAIAAIDYGWQVMEHQRKNRMSHKEMRDESKDSEGDPHLKQARRMKAQEIALTQMMSDVPTADVIIVNPTHYAVALKWEGSRTSAPICVAKGVDEIALRIRSVARDSDVAIHSDPPTARALFAVVEVGEEIKPEHYAAVAVAIRFAETLRQGKKR